MSKTKTLKQKCFDIAAGAFLAERPDDWDALQDHEQASFIEEHKWAPLENHSNECILSDIENLQDDVIQLIQGSFCLKTLDEPKKPYFLVNLRVVHGEYNEDLPCIIQSDEEHRAAKQAIDQHARCKLVWENLKVAYDCCGDIALIVDSVIPLPNEHAAVLKQYIH